MRGLSPLLLAASLALPAQTDPPGGKPLPWEIISIHVTDPAHADNGSEHTVDNGLSQHAMTMDFFISEAYSFTIFPSKDLIERLPDWVRDTKFDVEARVASEDVPAYKKLTGLSIPETAAAFARHQYTGEMLMEQALLSDRFHLKVHTEMRERSVYLLTVARGGVKMKPAADPAHGSASISRGQLTGKGIPVSFIAGVLSMPAGGMVVDQSDDHGQYDFELHFAPQEMDATAAGTSNDPDLFTAVQEQLGLKVTRGKAEVPVLVVDHIEKPSEN